MPPFGLVPAILERRQLASVIWMLFDRLRVCPPCASCQSPAFVVPATDNWLLATDPSTRPAASLRISPAGSPPRLRSGSRPQNGSIQHMNVLLLAHLLQHFWPHSDADFAEVGFAQQQHQRPRLPDAATD